MGKAFLIGFLFLYTSSVYAQRNQQKADSLITVFENKQQQLTDTVKLKIILKICKNNNNTDQRIYYGHKALELSKKTNNLYWLYQSSIALSHAYRKKGDLQIALNYLFEALEYANQMHNEKRIAIAYSAIGTVYKVEGNFETALKFLNLAISHLRKVNDAKNLARSLMNTGELYRTNHILDTALLYFQEAGDLYQQLDYKLGTAYNIGNIGLVYAEQGKHTLAEEYIAKSTAVLEELGDRYPIAVYSTCMSDIYWERGEWDKAFAYAHLSHKIGVEEGLKEQIRDASLKLSELYGEAGDYQQAFEYHKQYVSYRDSLNNEDNIRKMADLRTKYEVAQKQVEVDILEKDKKIQQLLWVALTIITILISTLAIVFYRRGHKKIKINKILSEQKEELAAQRDQLDQLNHTKDRFFSIISHDLRSPVNGINGLVELIKMYMETKNYDELDVMVKNIDKSSTHLSFLLDNLLDWAINQQGEFPYHPEQINLKATAEEIIGIFQDSARAKELNLVIDIEEDVSVWADKNSVMTIIRNLVNNAIKFTLRNGTITIKGYPNGEFVFVKVIDTGIGIPQDKMDSLFLLKEKKSTGGTNGEKGLGLGLRLAFEFAEMNKGSIKVESVVRQGTTFTVSLPQACPAS
ncbi:tetratricopeptide repeat-containing sensor histidine kinase [Flammeovirgaceae bacterium SG7u.111]|nr:tetratricopeptide repeat-containing sensor histidine kinase [Flammeovirgaceae bacterium SG7u.132]WPO38794.1 tetratricopeptide repeat-containing sensor histidine kinase [Flammeovirgaceae bacterium SG7u.111]